MCYVYRFIDKDGKIIYIGKTINLASRFNVHFTKNGHLPARCYNETEKVFYSELSNNDEMSIYERYLINKYIPKYNTQFNNSSSFRFELPNLEWVELNNFRHELLEDVCPVNKITLKELNNNPSIDEIVEYNIRKYISDNNINFNYNEEYNKKIACVSLGNYDVKYIFENQYDAGKKIEVNSSNIYKATRKGNTCGGYMWKFLKDVIHNDLVTI